MSPAERATLAAKLERFDKLESDEQQRLRDLHGAIEADSAPEALRSTLAQYETWIAQLPPQVSAQLVGLPSGDRATKVAAIVAEQRETAANTFGEADSKVLVAWLEKQIRGHQDEMMTQLPQTMRERLENMGTRERTGALILFALSQRGPGNSLFPKLSATEWAELRAALSTRAQTQWNAASGNPEEFKLLLGGWVRQAMERQMTREIGPSMRVSDTQLKEFFERELTEEDRARFAALPRDAMMAQLRREYYHRKGLWRDGYWRGDGRRPGGGDDRTTGSPNEPGPSGSGGTRPFGRGPGSFGPRPGGGFLPGPGGPNPGGTNPAGPNLGPPIPGPVNPGPINPGQPRPNNGGNPPPPKPQA